MFWIQFLKMFVLLATDFPSRYFMLKPFLKGFVLPNKLKRKMYLYSIVVPRVLGIPYANAINVRINQKLMRVLVLNAAMIPLIDYITDQYENQADGKQRLSEVFYSLEKVEGEDPAEQLLKALYIELKLLSSEGDYFQKFLNKTFSAQIESIDQKVILEKKSIGKVLKNKGGYAVCQFLSVVDSSINSERENLLVQIGFYLQLINDLIDKDKDRANGINTLANLSSDAEYQNVMGEERQKLSELFSSIIGKSSVSEKICWEALYEQILWFGQLQLTMKKV